MQATTDTTRKVCLILVVNWVDRNKRIAKRSKAHSRTCEWTRWLQPNRFTLKILDTTLRFRSFPTLRTLQIQRSLVLQSTERQQKVGKCARVFWRELDWLKELMIHLEQVKGDVRWLFAVGTVLMRGCRDYAGSSFVFHDVRMLMVGNRTINFRPGLEVEDSKMLLRRPRTCIFSTIRLTLGRHDRRLIQRTKLYNMFFLCWGGMHSP